MSKKIILEEFGGLIKLNRTYSVGIDESFMRRIGFVRRKGTKAARKLPFDFDQQKRISA
jgi:hypothetical protein